MLNGQISMKKPNPKLLQDNYYGFDHKKVAEKFGGDLSFCTYLCVNHEYSPVAVYKAKNPDKSKGHKKYMLLQLDPNDTNKGIVRGMSQYEINRWRYQDAAVCLNCNTMIYSIMRHHNPLCECGAISIDGGKDYTKVNYKNLGDLQHVRLDLLTGKIKK